MEYIVTSCGEEWILTDDKDMAMEEFGLAVLQVTRIAKNLSGEGISETIGCELMVNGVLDRWFTQTIMP